MKSTGVGLLLLIVLSAVSVGGCAAPMDENQPMPGGRVLVGQIIGTSGMEFTDSSGQEVAAPQLVSVAVDGSTLDALYSDSDTPVPGQWVEVSEGFNGRWFITGDAAPPEAAVDESEPEPEEEPVETDGTRLAAILSQALDSYEMIFEGRDDGSDAATLKPELDRLKQAVKEAKKYRTWNDLYSPPNEGTENINWRLEELEFNAEQVLEAEWDEDSYDKILHSPERLECYESIAEWVELIGKGYPFRVENAHKS